MYFSNFLADARNVGIRNRNRWMRKWSKTARKWHGTKYSEELTMIKERSQSKVGVFFRDE